MPEEINRLVTDSISDMLLCSEPAGVENLIREGHPPERVHLVGNVMIDTLLGQVETAKQQDTLAQMGLTAGEYGVVTLHRPSNVDDGPTLSAILHVLAETSKRLPLVFPVHPRTSGRIEAFGLSPVLAAAEGVHLVPPQGYRDFLCLTSQAKVIVTDSGGLQEESTALNVPCLTMRNSTERPVTCEEGTSELVGNSADALRTQLNAVLNSTYKSGACPKLWDGKAAQRIVELICGNP